AGEELRGLGRAHAEYFAALADEAAPKLVGPEQAQWLERVEHEIDNVRAALHWCHTEVAEEPTAALTGLRLVAGFGRFWMLRGQPSEGRALVARALGACPDGPAPLRARTLKLAGHLAWM